MDWCNDNLWFPIVRICSDAGKGMNDRAMKYHNWCWYWIHKAWHYFHVVGDAIWARMVKQFSLSSRVTKGGPVNLSNPVRCGMNCYALILALANSYSRDDGVSFLMGMVSSHDEWFSYTHDQLYNSSWLYQGLNWTSRTIVKMIIGIAV